MGSTRKQNVRRKFKVLQRRDLAILEIMRTYGLPYNQAWIFYDLRNKPARKSLSHPNANYRPGNVPSNKPVPHSRISCQKWLAERKAERANELATTKMDQRGRK